jgi:glutathione S-transferase
MYKLYVIPGSHACRSAMLMLEHKQVPYRRVDVLTLLHPLAVRLRGFSAGGETRRAGAQRPLPLRSGDHLGTVPALDADGERISTNRHIARFLDDRHPEPALFPSDPGRHRGVEEAERWANDTLQMAARRILLAAWLRDPGGLSRASGDGRMGHLLYRRALTRRLVIPLIGRFVFAAGRSAEGDPIAGLPALLDRIDAWIADGILGGGQSNAADFMVAPSLALMLYRPGVARLFAGRPALELVDGLLPEPAS